MALASVNLTKNQKTVLDILENSSEPLKAYTILFDIQKKGSSLKFCDLGSGISNIYPRFGPVYQWDLAAGQAILESLEGVIIFKNSEESIYKFDPSRKINGFIAVSSKEDEEKIKKLSFF